MKKTKAKSKKVVRRRKPLRAWLLVPTSASTVDERREGSRYGLIVVDTAGDSWDGAQVQFFRPRYTPYGFHWVRITLLGDRGRDFRKFLRGGR